MKYKIICEVSFPALDKKMDIYVPINKSIEYLCNMLDKLIVETISPDYNPKPNSILVNQRTGKVYDKNKLVKYEGLSNGTKLTYY